MQMSKSGTTVQYQYDANGLRVGKIVNGTETTYTLHGKLLTHLKQGANEMHFYYDAQSRPAMVAFNGAYYMYLHNLQGDIVGLVDSSNNIVVEYKYDAWGKPTLKRSLTTAYDTLATLNPFRYRGYVYDEETGLYYLRSRFYNPAWDRFVNADIYIIASVEAVSTNVYAYCRDEPVKHSDIMGKWWFNDCVNWFNKNIVDPIVDAYDAVNEFIAENIRGTFSFGVNVSGTFGMWSFYAQIGISMDFKGNIGIQYGYGGGASTSNAAISAGIYVSGTNAPTIYYLNGAGAQFGGSVSGKVGGLSAMTGAEVDIIPYSEEETYYGVTLSGGIGTIAAGNYEFHTTWGNTETLFAVNIGSGEIYTKSAVKTVANPRKRSSRFFECYMK